MKLNLTSLRKTVKSLEVKLFVHDKYKNTEDKDLKIALRESVIQSFEVCYEFSQKIMRRYLKEYVGKDTDQMIVKDVFRLAEKSGVISSTAKWLEYRENRNNTSHVYDPKIADRVFLSAKGFLEDARFLLKKLEDKIES